MTDKKDYFYKAIVTDVHDGDTCTVDIDLGFGIWMKDQKLRLYGINTPELHGNDKEAGIKSRDYVKSLILGKIITLESQKDKTEKYGRWLATIWLDGININKKLVQEGYAREYLVN
jgi:micrococcal nuclease